MSMIDTVTLLKAIAEPTRLRLLALVQAAELTLGDLCAIVGQSQPRISRHLKILVDAGAISRMREGTYAYFALNLDCPSLALIREILAQLPADDLDLQRDAERLATLVRDRQARASEWFERHALGWDHLRSLYIEDTAVEAALLEALPDSPGCRLLDLGTGTGRMLELLGPRVHRAVGIDKSRQMLEVARPRLARTALNNCELRAGDVAALPFGDASFDVAVMHHVLHYLDRPDLVLAEAARVLGDNGRILIVDFEAHENDAIMQELAHLWPGFSDEEMARWASPCGLHLTRLASLPGKALTTVIWQAAKPQALDHSPTAPQQKWKTA